MHYSLKPVAAHGLMNGRHGDSHDGTEGPAGPGGFQTVSGIIADVQNYSAVASGEGTL